MNYEEIRNGKFLITLPEMNRFFESVNKTDGCWYWNGYKDKLNYGRTWKHLI